MFVYFVIVMASFMAVLLFLNLYFRIKILGLYRKLVENEVDFPPSYLINTDKMEAEIIPKYPQCKEVIRSFQKHIRRSLKIAFVVFVLALLIGYQYVKNR